MSHSGWWRMFGMPGNVAPGIFVPGKKHPMGGVWICQSSKFFFFKVVFFFGIATKKGGAFFFLFWFLNFHPLFREDGSNCDLRIFLLWCPFKHLTRQSIPPHLYTKNLNYQFGNVEVAWTLGLVKLSPKTKLLNLEPVAGRGNLAIYLGWVFKNILQGGPLPLISTVITPFGCFQK